MKKLENCLNMTGNPSNQLLIKLGIVGFQARERQFIRGLLDFPYIPSAEEVRGRANILAELAQDFSLDSSNDITTVLIDVPGFMTYYLEKALNQRGFIVAHPFWQDGEIAGIIHTVK